MNIGTILAIVLLGAMGLAIAYAMLVSARNSGQYVPHDDKKLDDPSLAQSMLGAPRKGKGKR